MAMTIPFPTTVTSRVRVAREKLRGALARARTTSRVARARAGYGAGMLSAAWGVGVLYGFGWSLISGGLVTAWSFLHLYPVDKP
jgi:hypothetical protein